jgi:hypothetical protein
MCEIFAQAVKSIISEVDNYKYNYYSNLTSQNQKLSAESIDESTCANAGYHLRKS